MPELKNYEMFVQRDDVSRSMVVAAANKYKGVKYSLYHSRVGVDNSQVDCLRFIMFTARDVGYLIEGFDIDKLRRPRPKQTIDAVLYEFLKSNMDEIPKDKLSIKPADIVLMRYRDVTILNDDVHHVGFVTQMYEIPGLIGKWIHAEDFRLNNIGEVIEQDISPLTWNRIESVWRFRGIKDE